MSAIGFTDKFRRLGREYLMQTSANELRKTIFCSLFSSGQLISSRSFPLPELLDNASRLNYVSKVHEECLAEIDSLLGLVERMQDLQKPEIIEKLGKTLCARDLYDEGRELLAMAVIKYPEMPGLHFIMGKLCLAKGKYEEARDHLVHAVELAASYPDYKNYLGMAYLKLMKPVAAIDEFRKAAELNIYYDSAHYNLGLGFILNGIVREDFNLARDLPHNCQEAFHKATLYNPGYLNENYEKGMNWLLAGNLEQAYDLLTLAGKEAISHSSEEKLLEMYLRYLHGEKGMTEVGIQQYIERINELLKSNPGHADLHNELGMAYTVMSKFMNNKATEHFKEALRLNPNFLRASKNLKLSQNDLKGFEVLLEAIVK